LVGAYQEKPGGPMTDSRKDCTVAEKSGRVPSLSLIIAVYKRADFLEKILLSLQNQTMKDFEIVIADDGSGPEISDLIQRYGPSFSIPIRHVWHEDCGFRKTVIANRAVSAAQSRYLVFIDGDCVLHHRFLESHFRHRRPGTALAGRRVMLDRDITGRLTNDDIASRRIERPWFWWRHCASGDRKHGLSVPGLFWVENTLKRRYSMYGSNFSVFKEEYAAVNGYDENIIGRGIEDDNLRERLKLNGVKIRTITREAVQFHLYHEYDPVPHSRDVIKEFCFPKKAWTESGIVKAQAFGQPVKQDKGIPPAAALSLIIAVYNRPDFLEKIFLSCINQTFSDFEIVVADDGSGPEVADVIKRFSALFRYPIQHVRQENQGFRKTIIANKAVVRSRGGYLVFIDGDCILQHRFLEDHMRCRRIGTVLSGRRVMFDEELTGKITADDVQSRRFEKPSFWFNHSERSSVKHGVRLRAVSATENWWHTVRGKQYDILGSNFSVYKSDFYRVNGYEEAITGRGLEDNNLANRFKRAGIRVRTVARRAVQYHLFHTADPIPHDRETISRLGDPADFWAVQGICGGRDER
jgi:glycosyltransferase involved in cell wall biosynthesis